MYHMVLPYSQTIQSDRTMDALNVAGWVNDLLMGSKDLNDR